MEVRLSQLTGIANTPEEFAAMVQAHIQALHDHVHTVNIPRPTTHPIVNAVLKRKQAPMRPDVYVPDYTLIDDLPKPEEPKALTLEEQKEQLYFKLAVAERAAMDKVITPRKMRLLAVTATQSAVKHEDERSDAEKELLRIHKHLNDKWNKINLIAAKAGADIEDLTERTIPSWKIPDFD